MTPGETRDGGRRVPLTLEELGVAGLSVEDRLSLAQAIWESVAAELGGGLTPAQAAELDRRTAPADAQPGRGVPWKDVLAAARARWGR
jgi:putative addiction module component (TIGR02574 family)